MKTKANKINARRSAQKSSDRSARTRGRAAKAAFDPEAVLASAVVTAVALSDIDVDDKENSFRKIVKRCDPKTFIPEAGAVDGTKGHVIILLGNAATGSYKILSGFRRLAGMMVNPDVTHVRCMVLESVSEAVATVLAARANLDNAQPLTKAEARQAFYAEYEALKTGGFKLPSLREFARQYHVSHGSPGNWLKKLDEAGTLESGGNGSVQFSHRDQGDADGCTYSARETLESFKVSVEMIETLAVEQVAELIEDFRTWQQRLDLALARCAVGAEEAA